MINGMDCAKQLFHAAIICFVVCLCAGYGQASGPMLEVSEVWSGDFPVAALSVLPEDQRDAGVGYIDSPDLFDRVWKHLQPGRESPTIDFSDHIVLFVRNTKYYNAIRIGGVKVTDEGAEILAMQTMSARPIEDVIGFSMAVVEQGEITAVRNGDELITLPR